jgi:hypothetical protein
MRASSSAPSLGEELASIRTRLDEEGSVRFPVQVRMEDADGNEVARMKVTWRMKRV